MPGRIGLDHNGAAAEAQSEAVQRLRGPYTCEHRAKHAATKHFDEQ